MKKLTLEEHVKMMDRATCVAFEKLGCMHPLYHMTDKDGNEHVIPAPPLPKDLVVMLVRDMLKTMGATRVVMIDEAWVISGGAEVEGLVEEHGSVEHTPGRIEVVIYAAEDETEGSIMASRQILRDGDEATLGPLEFTSRERDQQSGRMVGLLPVKGSLH